MITTYVPSDAVVYQTFDLFGVGIVIVGIALITTILLLLLPIPT